MPCTNEIEDYSAFVSLEVAFYRAAEQDLFERTKHPIEMRADIHSGHDHALRWASEKGRSDVVRYLESF